MNEVIHMIQMFHERSASDDANIPWSMYKLIQMFHERTESYDPYKMNDLIRMMLFRFAKLR